MQKQSIEASYYPTLSLLLVIIILAILKCLGLPSDGVYWSDFSAIGLNLRVPIFTGFGTRAKVRQADGTLTLTNIKDTQLALDFKKCTTQIEIA
jgi:outer membrane protein TolC